LRNPKKLNRLKIPVMKLIICIERVKPRIIRAHRFNSMSSKHIFRSTMIWQFLPKTGIHIYQGSVRKLQKTKRPR
jgi:hypothetical protein